jgi:hypothetical protein
LAAAPRAILGGYWIWGRRPTEAERLARELAAGQGAELFDAVGQPRAASWPVGELGKLQRADDGACALLSEAPVLVELAAGPGMASYRFRAEVRHDAGQAEGLVGLYCGRRAVAAGGRTFQLFTSLTFTDVLSHDQERKDWEAQGLLKPGEVPNPLLNPIHLAAFLYAGKGPRDAGERVELVKRDTPLFMAQVPLDGVWRRLTLDVTPLGVSAFWGDPGRRAADASFRFADVAVERKAAFGLIPAHPARDAQLPAGPDGGLGLYVFKGLASFRGAALEPM